ncbi:MAG: MAPEG family protein [Pseudomonadota bacterium]
MHPTILICSASIAILTLLLAFWTSIQRGASSTIAYGAPLDPASAMAKAQRAHGNAAEYAALLIALFFTVGFAYQDRDLGDLVTWTVIAVTVSRVLHALGFLICATLEKPHVLKAIGAIITYIGGLLLAGLAVSKVL